MTSSIVPWKHFRRKSWICQLSLTTTTKINSKPFKYIGSIQSKTINIMQRAKIWTFLLQILTKQDYRNPKKGNNGMTQMFWKHFSVLYHCTHIPIHCFINYFHNLPVFQVSFLSSHTLTVSMWKKSSKRNTPSPITRISQMHTKRSTQQNFTYQLAKVAETAPKFCRMKGYLLCFTKAMY